MNAAVPFFMLLFWISFSGVSSAEDPAAKVRISINTEGGFWVGQRVPLVVELLAPGYFTGTPAYQLPQVPGVLILPPVGSPTVGSEQIGGVPYTLQRYELMVFARTTAPVTIPPIQVRLEFKRQPLDQEVLFATVETEAVSFTAKQPPGSGADESLITSHDLTVTESWKPEPGKQAKTGNAFVRTIAWSASDVPGMAFQPFDPGHIDGLGIYRGDPVVNDTSDRGQLKGQRKDTVTYVCKTGGHIVIPAVSVRWWDPVDKKISQVDFPAKTFDVVAPPAPPVPTSVRILRALRHHGPAILGWCAAIIAFALLIYFERSSILRFSRRLLPRHLSPLNPT